MTPPGSKAPRRGRKRIGDSADIMANLPRALKQTSPPMAAQVRAQQRAVASKRNRRRAH
jgi:hypothetical protein